MALLPRLNIRSGLVRSCVSENQKVPSDFVLINKLTVNKVSPVEQYPIPKVHEILSSVSGSTHYTKLDLKAAYDQLELDEDSKKYTTINTLKGLYQYNKVPHEISSGPAICQCEMENQLKGIPHTGCRLGDFLVSGATPQEHLANVEEVSSDSKKTM